MQGVGKPEHLSERDGACPPALIPLLLKPVCTPPGMSSLLPPTLSTVETTFFRLSQTLSPHLVTLLRIPEKRYLPLG